MEYLNYIYPIMGLGGLGAVLWFAFRSGLPTMQKQAIEALKDRLDAQDRRIVDLERENAIQAHEMNLMKSAFEQLGLIIMIKGDAITMSDKDGTSTIIKTQQAAQTSLSASAHKPKKPRTRTKTAQSINQAKKEEV